MTYLGHPFGIGGDGRTATTGADGHVRDLVEQVLFTAPGERVNRPDFGSGLLGLVFEPNSEALASAVRARVEGALHRWLGEVIQVETVTVRAVESTLAVQVGYVVRATGERTTAAFRGPVTP
ncbi:GPW/gp25 family protein [Streptomyces sp. NPDC096132]|uniref:GPW/gp25 family protein n=1 Tax=Streptomyces sp. NPDC096132 TaxID=3366075 RepID=UPI00382EDEA6